MKVRSWSALFLLLASQLTAHSIGPFGLPGVGALIGAEGLPAGDLRLGLDNRFLPEARLYASTLDREEYRALSSTQTLFASFGAGRHLTLSAGLPIEIDLPSSSQERYLGIGDLQLRGMLGYWFPAQRAGVATELGLSMGIASEGAGMIPRNFDLLRDDQVSSPLGRRRAAALFAASFIKELGGAEYPWRAHLRTEVRFPSNHYPIAFIEALAIEKVLPFDWSVGSDLLFGTQLNSTDEIEKNPTSLKWGLNATFKTNRDFYAAGGVAWELWREGETVLREQGVERIWKPQSSVELRLQFGMTLHLKKKRVEEEKLIRKENPATAPEELVEEREEEPASFDEFEQWKEEESCSKGIEVYGESEDCYEPFTEPSKLKSGIVPAITFAPGSEEWSLEAFAPLDSIAKLMTRERSVGLEIVVPMGRAVPLPSSVRLNLTPEELGERRARSLVSYMVARGVKKERLKWRVVSGEGGVLFLFD